MNQSDHVNDIQLWGGIECTVNRIGDQYFDQVVRSGHADRLDDLDRFAELGLRTLRYPILWERVAPNGLAQADWTWADERLHRLRQLEIRPIVGLCHHGSGPRGTDLLDPAFPDLLADFAAAVATRYPWVDAYTPVNEPLTTARFAALYGHWYPHRRDEGSFIHALLHQCAAVARAMARIRRVNPDAQLIQTEDLAKTWSTPEIAHQAAFENDRRWLTFDLLCGGLDRRHPLWNHLVEHGPGEHLLRQFLDDPCPPDLLGVNYYVTGERFLDHRLEHYPPQTHGGNGRERYADVEAVRVLEDGISGPIPLLREVWERYERPIAITEAHLGCTREEQVRWLSEVWTAACTLKQSGIDIRAVTVWSLLGAFDWHTLLTRQEDYYEPGVFDVRGPAPRPTALATTVAEIIQQRRAAHPLAETPGWWHREARLFVPLDGPHPPVAPVPDLVAPTTATLLIVAAGDAFDRALAEECAIRGIPYQVRRPGEADLADEPAMVATLRRESIWAVIDATTYDRFDCHGDDARRHGAHAVRRSAQLAAACGSVGARLLTFSSDQVFDGAKGAPYVESDPVQPGNQYGAACADMERAILVRQPDALVIRTNPVFGLRDLQSFGRRFDGALTAEPDGSAPPATITLTFGPDLIPACLDFLVDGERGVLHLSNPGTIGTAEIAEHMRGRTHAGAGPTRSRRGARQPANQAARAWTELGSERAWVLPSLPDALARYLGAAH